VLDHLNGSPHPPAIIIVSGNQDEQEAREFLQRGAFDYVTTPVDLTCLKRAIAAGAGRELPQPAPTGIYMYQHETTARVSPSQTTRP
jgi:CheY-like chemotaxis protein